eukprot:364181-Chlamydomonas_euryale.AAC.3
MCLRSQVTSLLTLAQTSGGKRAGPGAAADCQQYRCAAAPRQPALRCNMLRKSCRLCAHAPRCPCTALHAAVRGRTAGAELSRVVTLHTHTHTVGDVGDLPRARSAPYRPTIVSTLTLSLPHSCCPHVSHA